MTFFEWIHASFDHDTLIDIANHGAACGFDHITYYADIRDLFNRFDVHIFNFLSDMADCHGCTVSELIGSFDGLIEFHNKVVWTAIEMYATQYQGAREDVA